MRLGQKQFDMGNSFPKMFQMIYKTDVYVWILPSDPPIPTDILNWRKPFQIICRQNGELE